MAGFDEALLLLKEGKRLSRSSWNSTSQYIGFCVFWNGSVSPNSNECHQQPFIYIRSLDCNIFPWTPNHTDLLAEDWIEVL